MRSGTRASLEGSGHERTLVPPAADHRVGRPFEPTPRRTTVRLRTRLLPIVAATGLVLAACGDGNDPADGEVGTTDDVQTDTTEPVDETEDGLGDDEFGEVDATEEGAEDATEEDAAADTDAAAAATASGLDVASSDLGEHLVDDAGNTLYVNVEDAECGPECAIVWPPVTVDGEPDLGDGVDEALVGTTERPDGSPQVTYADQPLHTFVSDEPGQAGGQGVAAAWYIVAPDGSPIGAEAVAAGEDDADDEDDEG
jgi:predicted lipoprotein with Yx(FWY)xxD motif